jgi:hypothetical protein
MKIISKFKDYYDFLIGQYGIDPLIVYERRPQIYNDNKTEDSPIITLDYFTKLDVPTIHSPQPTLRRFTFSICDQTYIIYSFNKVLYCTLEDQLNLFSFYKEKGKYSYSDVNEIKNNIYYIFNHKIPNEHYSFGFWGEKEKSPYLNWNLNTKYKCPVILLGEYSNVGRENKLYLNPKLDTFQFSKILPAHDIFLMITQFLTKKDITMPNDPTDMSRYEGKGFDKKTSFRNIK